MIGTTLASLVFVMISTVPGEMVVATEALPRGTIIAPGMLEGPGAENYIGQQLNRPAFAGKPVTSAMISAPDMVTRQSPVTVMFRRKGLQLTTMGKALKSGAVGDAVPILLEGRRQPVYATVIGPGEVEVRR